MSSNNVSHIRSKNFYFFWRSRFLDKSTRDDAFKVYSFIQVLTSFVDSGTKQDIAAFVHIEKRWKTIKKELIKNKVPPALDDSPEEQALANIAYVVHRLSCDTAWVDAMLHSKRWDLERHEYASLKDTDTYTYGTFEVVALFMARILRLPEEALTSARMQGRAIGYIHYLYDLQADAAKGRCYFSSNEYKKYGLKNLSIEEATAKPKMFADFVHAQLLRYAKAQAVANKGYVYIPKKVRAPLQGVIDTYNGMAQKLKENPLTIYDKNFRPKRRSVVRHTIVRSLKRTT